MYTIKKVNFDFNIFVIWNMGYSVFIYENIIVV